MAAAVAPLVLEGYLPLGSLVASPCEGLLEGGKAAEFAVAVLSEVGIIAMFPRRDDPDKVGIARNN